MVGFEALSRASRLAHPVFDGYPALVHDFERASGLFLNTADGRSDFLSGLFGALGEPITLVIGPNGENLKTAWMD